MFSERDLRKLARQALDVKAIPNRQPDRVWGGTGIDAPCTICQVPVPRAEMEYELQFVRDGEPELDKFHVHLQYGAVLELVRHSLPKQTKAAMRTKPATRTQRKPGRS